MAPLIDSCDHSIEVSEHSQPECFELELEHSPRVPQQGKRRVTFSETPDIVEISNKDDFTPEEKQFLWVTPSDWSKMQADRQRILRAAAFGNLSPENSTRGLESIMPTTGAQRKRNILNARMAVLQKQAEAQRFGYVDPQVLASLYDEISRRSKQSAHTQGVADYFEVKRGVQQSIEV
eukprot:Nitzschia sp. Nitz4//scaffold32_size149145//26662//27195//NITZ4_002867-RA/size149145-processed-gene-0.117-mRNA-1//-1//CDS//3329548033//1078//frame0